MHPTAPPGALALFLVALAGCGAFPGDFDHAPLARSLEHPGSGRVSGDYFGPLIPRWTHGETTKIGLRPLFVRTDRPYREQPDRRETVVSILPPFSKYHSNPRTTQFRFWPLFWIANEKRKTGGTDFDWLLFPILMYGSTETTEQERREGDRDGRYFAAFPLAGSVETFVGWDSWSFLAWPILQRLTKRVFTDPEDPGEVESFNSIALLFGWTQGEPRGGSWHALPAYMQSQWTYPPFRAPDYPAGVDPSLPLPRYDKRSYLWPFVHWQRLHLDRGPGKETELLAVWPLFKREVSYDHVFWTILWPFFRFNYEYPLKRESARAEAEQPDVSPQEAESDENANVLIDVFTQLVWRYQRTEDWLRRRLLFILYAEYHTLPYDKPNRIDSMSILQPIGFWKRRAVERNSDGGYRDDSIFFLVPFFQHHYRSYLDEGGADDGRHDRFWRLWPAFSYENNADGSADVQTLVFLPLRIEKYVQDFNEGWGFLWNLYRYRRDPDAAGGAERHTAIFELVEVYDDARETSVSVPLLVSWRTRDDADGVRRFSRRFLFGLFGLDGEDGPQRSSRELIVFGFPVELG